MPRRPAEPDPTHHAPSRPAEPAHHAAARQPGEAREQGGSPNAAASPRPGGPQNPPEAAEPPGLKRCPECERELDPHNPPRCPDCGFPLLPPPILFRPRRPWSIYITFAAGLLFLPGLLRLLRDVFFAGVSPEPATVLTGLVALGALAWSVPRLRVVLVDGRRYAALTEAGIHARTPRQTLFIPWTDVERIEDRMGIPGVRARTRPATVWLEWVFDTDGQAAEFRRLAEEKRAEHSESR